ncbi:hypothetical protein [Streptomyces chrestomyceticus]
MVGGRTRSRTPRQHGSLAHATIDDVAAAVVQAIARRLARLEASLDTVL